MPAAEQVRDIGYVFDADLRERTVPRGVVTDE
jgi:hypothetical protein